MLKVAGKRCVVVGGGAVALRRARSLLEAGADVSVVAPEVATEFDGLAVAVHRRAFEARDAEGCAMVIVATDDPRVNKAVSAACPPGTLVNRADAPEAGDVQFVATAQAGPATIGVHTGGVSASAAAAIRDEIAANLDPRWATLLAAAARYRPLIQTAVVDPAARQAALRRLTDAEAMAILKGHGEAALGDHLERLLRDASTAPPPR